MARLNIEDCWWTDLRRSALISLIGDEFTADGVAVRAWRVAQEFWKHGRGLVPRGLFETLKYAHEFIAAGLAEVREDGVYVRGSSAYLDWVAERREAAKRGGLKSAEQRQANSNQTEANAKQTQPSVSGSFSGSKKNTNTARTGVRAEYTAAFEGAWEAFGKEGKKSDAFKAFEELCLSEAEYQSLLVAIRNYLADCKSKDRRSMYMGTFLREDWRVWIERRGAVLKPKTLDEVMNGL